ncbi:MAG: DUF2156 domain-containing protein [Candidatus Omnitrophica bacterium]|nr:DUF2156 domain-containing protein [Candidatus Omnitrophota bacterium]
MKNIDPTAPLAAFVRQVPQIVPEEWCFRCKVCCRFPDTEGVQTPAWSSLEAEWLDEGGGAPKWLKPVPDSPSLLPVLERCGEGFRCPAFDAASSRCTIHSDRPLDCRLYPFVLAQSPGGSEAVLAMDAKCPYLQEHGGDPEVVRYASDLAAYLNRPEAEEYLRQNPKIVGPFWPEFVSVAALPKLTQAVQGPPRTPHPALRPVTLNDAPRLKEALSARRRSHSAHTVAALLGWSDVIRLWQAEAGGSLCLFSEQGGGLFMSLPPLGEKIVAPALDAAWSILTEANQGGSVSRIEGIGSEDIEALRAAGFSVTEQEREFLYEREDLAALRGDPYRSQRGSVNRFRRAHAGWTFRPFEPKDLVPCLRLYTRWAIERQKNAPEGHARLLVRDGLFFHRRLMISGPELGAVGRVLEADGRVRGYTFGAPVSADTFCVFLEIADRGSPGAAQVMFREFCRELRPYRWINAMGDSGLEGLCRAKLSYRPAGVVSTWSAQRVSV